MSAVPYLTNILSELKIDVIAIAEHWLRKSQFHFLNTVDSNYRAYGKSVDEYHPELYNCNFRGGVAFLVSNYLCPFIVELDIESNRICGIEIQFPGQPSVFLISVYLPATTQPFHLFVDELEYLMDIYRAYTNLGTVFLLGDFNCKIEGPRYKFVNDKRSNLLNTHLEATSSVSLHTLTFAIGPIHTFQSYDGGPKTAIDHIITQRENICYISEVFIPDEDIFNVSDHKPIICTMEINGYRRSDNLNQNPLLTQLSEKVAWTKAIELNLITDYSFAVSQNLWSVCAPSSPATAETIESYYKTIVDAIMTADHDTLPHKSFVKHLKPYWTNTVKINHAHMRKRRADWIANGKIHNRNNYFFRAYKDAKRDFRKELELAYNAYMKDCAQKLEESIDSDQKYVWSVLKSRRKQKVICRELRVNGRTYTDDNDICEAWADHFESIFKTDRTLLNPEREQHMKQTIADIRNCFKAVSENITEFEYDEVYNVCKKLKNNKSTGLDKVSYEHVKYGGKQLQKHLCALFNLIIQNCYIPVDWKSSVIIPLFKGGNKDKTDPNSFRGISLTSCISKIFEKILVPHLEPLQQNFPHPTQMAYQKLLCSTHASFTMQEMIRHYIERNSKVIVVLMDSMKAFDSLWHDALLLKLKEYGVCGKFWLLIDEMYRGMKSSILFNNKLSRWFQLQRGVRQGGVLSAVLYLAFINDLLIELNKTSYGTILYDIRVACSVQADDIALMSPTTKGMQTLINICQLFSERWAFKFSPSKSHVLLYGKCQSNTIDRLFLYGSEIPIVKSTKHVGILLESSFNSMEQTINACHMLRATTISIMNSGVHPAILNTSTCLKIVNQLAYTRALYGCELWNNLTKSELLLLERAHRFVCKAVQGLPKRSRSDKCTSLLGWLCIECYIDKCKLLFFGRLCRLNSAHLPKQIMMARLLEFKYTCVDNQLGFIPDMYRLFIKYNLLQYVVNLIELGSFPSKIVWNNVVSQNIHKTEQLKWLERISNDSDFNFFKLIHPVIKLHKAWIIAKRYPDLRVASKYIIDLCAIVRIEAEQLLCEKCGKLFTNVLEHILCSCDFVLDYRNEMWRDIININPIQFSVYMDSLSSLEFTATILSCDTIYVHLS
ncbi:unnamed protein product [Mytilus edulis]|uniref:Reverse transcriptase domain-containing protein n=1 Tax=Mytilus edulis TaxID=6550 RepID=A0A8S3UKZ6_MYTED|nr:unnamed protein product [Mytilus edulis]